VLRLFNTLTHRIQPFAPLTEGEVRMYTCGPTVYRPVHLGNLRSYLLADWLRRTFEFEGLRVIHVKNITDVGHMRQDAVDRGEDKVISAALAAGKTPMEIAATYERAFLQDERDLGILPASVYPRATEHVADMVAMIERLLARGLAYNVDGTVYYSVRRFPGYGQLSGNVQEALRQGVRAEVDPAKRDASDFALWKRAESDRTALTWPSPWSDGYPGWHIECSAMSTRYLGERFDLHTGGVDNIFPHHEDEIAQSEGALAHAVVGTWVHGQHLLADGVKMAKSARNTTEIVELGELGIDPLAFRYQALMTHYRARMHFTLAALRQAAEGLDHLRQRVRHLAQLAPAPQAAERSGGRRSSTSDAPPRPTNRSRDWIERFRERLHDDLDMPGALAVAQACVADVAASPADRLGVLAAMDAVLGLDLASVARERETAPVPIRQAADDRVRERGALRLRDADALRLRFDGWRVDDHQGPAVLISDGRRRLGRRGQTRISSAAELPDWRQEPATASWSVCIVSREYPEDLARCVASVHRWLPAGGEVVLLDQGSSDESARRAALLDGGPVHVALADRDLGEGAGRNALLRLARGRLLLQLDPSVELTGDLFTPIAEALRSRTTGASGPWGLRAVDHLKEFEEITSGACDAIQGYCFATRRDDLLAIGGFDERYRFYRNLDIATSLGLRERGLASIAAGGGRAARHEHRAWERLPEDERQKRSRRNNDRLTRRFSALGVGT
jgi:cysteinyl-tRNA synthetase